MKRRSCAAVVLLVGALLTGCVPNACPAIMHIDSSPIQLKIDATLVGSGAVAACFGQEFCEPAALTPPEEGPWVVPQEPPFLREDAAYLGPGASVRVVISDSAAEVIHDEWHEIPYDSETSGSCPGPYTFLPVTIPA